MKKSISFFIFWLLAVNLFALLVLNRFNLESDTAYSWIDPAKTQQEQSWNIQSLHARWDSFWYVDIAQHGYHLEENNTLANIVFFPLYPFLIRAVSFITLGDYILAGWIISTLALLGAIIVLHKIVKEFHPEINPEMPIFYLLIFPTAFFLNVLYTESLFLLLSLLTFYYAFKKQPTVAGVFGMLAALTRVTGILLFIPFLWEYFKNREAKKPNISFVSILLIPLGTFLFFLYHYIRFGDFFLFLKIESSWGRAFQFNPEHFTAFSHPAVINLALDIIFIIFALVATYLVFKRSWISYGLYILATLVIAISTGTLMSIGRYVLVLFPIYIALATIKNEHFEKMYVMASLLLFALNTTLFVNYYWAG